MIVVIIGSHIAVCAHSSYQKFLRRGTSTPFKTTLNLCGTVTMSTRASSKRQVLAKFIDEVPPNKGWWFRLPTLAFSQLPHPTDPCIVSVKLEKQDHHHHTPGGSLLALCTSNKNRISSNEPGREMPKDKEALEPKGSLLSLLEPRSADPFGAAPIEGGDIGTTYEEIFINLKIYCCLKNDHYTLYENNILAALLAMRHHFCSIGGSWFCSASSRITQRRKLGTSEQLSV
jgi:hypothetical protein